MSTAKEEIFARIRQANAGEHKDAGVAYARIERNYRKTAVRSREETLKLFEERLLDYNAGVHCVREEELGSLCAQLLAARDVRRVVVPTDLPHSWWAEAASGAEFVVDEEFSARALDSFDAVMTGATLAMAETGTIVLQNAPMQGRRAISLVPDYHLCVVRAQDVVETVVEGMRRLDETRHLPMTFFSGPSATADIEMQRIKGVHGPRFVDVMLLTA
jgi:L-lactate dehydrogenase complex protein LldG